MLYWLTALSDGGDAFNLFRYITFRAGGAFFTALIFGFLFGPPLINVLRRRQGKGQPIRADGPEGHFAKAGTPTMGGLLILLAVLSSTLLWARLDNGFVWIVLFVTFSFGLIGFADDYAKVSRQSAAGVRGDDRVAAAPQRAHELLRGRANASLCSTVAWRQARGMQPIRRSLCHHRTAVARARPAMVRPVLPPRAGLRR